MNDTAKTSIVTIIGLTALAGLVAFGMWGCPRYSVYWQDLEGQAELARAEQNRRITIAEAEAKREAAKALAMAEVERAKGNAQANEIVAKGLGGPEGYLRYLWIDALHQAGASTNGSPNCVPQIIYVPTEAGMPLLEATRMMSK